MNLSSYILAGLNILPKTNVIINGSTVEALINQSSHNDNKTFGGFSPDNLMVITVKTSLLTSPKTLKGKLCVYDYSNWRITTVNYGESVTHLTMISDDKL